MQVTCPKCGARYAVDPRAIGPAGRTVQCALCSERWFEQAPPLLDDGPPLNEPLIRETPSESGTPHRSGLPALFDPRRLRLRWKRWVTASVALVAALAVIAFVYREAIGARLLPLWQTILGFNIQFEQPGRLGFVARLDDRSGGTAHIVPAVE